MSIWIPYKTVIDGDRCEVDGLNIWEHDWVNTHEYISVKDPIYGQNHTMTIYQIVTPHKTVAFAAGEFSIMVWGIYLKI